MNKNPLIEKLLSESIDDKINELTSKLDSKVNIMEIDAYDLEYEETYELDNSKGKPKRVIFKGRGKKVKVILQLKLIILKMTRDTILCYQEMVLNLK